MAERVRDQVEEHALDLVGGDRRGRLAVRVRHELDVAAPPPRAASSRQRRVDETRDGKLLELEGERAGVDPRQLEQVVDEDA